MLSTSIIELLFCAVCLCVFLCFAIFRSSCIGWRRWTCSTRCNCVRCRAFGWILSTTCSRSWPNDVGSNFCLLVSFQLEYIALSKFQKHSSRNFKNCWPENRLESNLVSAFGACLLACLESKYALLFLLSTAFVVLVIANSLFSWFIQFPLL